MDDESLADHTLSRTLGRDRSSSRCLSPMLPHPHIPQTFLRRLFLVCSGSSPPPWTPGTGLHRAMYGDDGLIERIKWWTQGSRDRIITSLANLAKHFGVVKEVAVRPTCRRDAVQFKPRLVGLPRTYRCTPSINGSALFA